MAGIPIERSYSLRDAEGLLTEELDRLGLSFDVEVAGRLVHAARCTIREKASGRPLASGNGKGEVDAARVGSLFEATEHLLAMYPYIDPDRISFRNSLEFCRGNPMCDRLPLVLLRSGPGVEIPFLHHRAVDGPEACHYPLALACPEYIDLQREGGGLRRADAYDYRRLEQYSTNSGTAIGMNAEEAIIHGLLEGIERTSLSEFLADTFLSNKKGSLRRVAVQTLPTSLGEVADRLETESSSKVHIFQMPNKFGIPAYVSWMEQYDFRIGLVGYGCSLSVEHAILRCLHELAQYYILSKHIFGFDWLKSKAGAIPTELEGLPLHQDCAVFDMAWKCRTLGYELFSYDDLPSLQFAHDPKTYLAQLTALIRRAGETPYASEIKTLESGIAVFHTFITGEDRFFNVKNCKSTFPASVSRLVT